MLPRTAIINNAGGIIDLNTLKIISNETGSAFFGSAGAKARYGTISAGNIATDQDFSIDCWLYHKDTFSTEAPVFDIGGYYTGGINGAMMCRVDGHGQSKLTIQFPDLKANILGV